jgi:hypothetical protein
VACDSVDHIPSVVFVVGVNAVGKSSFSRDLAQRLSRCAYIEVDELRYKVFGGLVAHSRGVHPNNAPAKYGLQCEMANQNAVLLAGGFAEYGFSVVIDGLEEKYANQRSWLAIQIPSVRLISVGLFCDRLTLQVRRAQRGWPPELPDGTDEKLAWYRANRGGFDYVIDTSLEGTDPLSSLLNLGVVLS